MTTAWLFFVVLITAGLLAAMLVAGALAMLATGALVHLRLWRRHRDLQLVQRFVSERFGDHDAARQAALPDAAIPGAELAAGVDLLARVRHFMGAESAELVVDDERGLLSRVRVQAASDDVGNGDTCIVRESGVAAADWPLLRVRQEGRSLLVSSGTRDRSLQTWRAATDTHDAILVPVPHGIGDPVLIVRNRVDGSGGAGSESGGFGPRDVTMLRALAEHFAHALHTSRTLYRLRYEATHDPLTGLANRTVLTEQLRLELAAIEVGGNSGGLAVLLLDLNRFKEVNDTLGHHVGDALLQVVAQRLRGALPSSATIARLGGDEFAIVLTGLKRPEIEARDYADAVIASLATPVRLDDALVTSEVSIGIALADAQAQSAELLRHADTAMYTAKSGGDHVRVYTAALDHGRAERLALAADLQNALEGDEFILLYQPKLSLDTDRVTGVEALVRWQHPQLGLLEPDAFIPLAEATGLVEPLTRIVLAKALRQCRDWARLGLELSVAVNLPARSVANPTLPSAVAELLRQNGVDPSQLTLEITERSVIDDPERSVPVLDKLAATGVTLSLDDFGTGYSSLSYLQRLPVREVKIDRSFVAGLTDPDRSQDALAGTRECATFVRNILSLAAGLELRVVAEGVEDEQCLELLRALGLDVVQGYFVGRPMEAAQLARQLANHRSPTPVPAMRLTAVQRVEASARDVPEPRERRGQTFPGIPGRGQERPSSPEPSSP